MASEEEWMNTNKTTEKGTEAAIPHQSRFYECANIFCIFEHERFLIVWCKNTFLWQKNAIQIFLAPLSLKNVNHKNKKFRVTIPGLQSCVFFYLLIMVLITCLECSDYGGRGPTCARNLLQASARCSCEVLMHLSIMESLCSVSIRNRYFIQNFHAATGQNRSWTGGVTCQS